MHSLSRFVFGALALLCFGQMAYYYPLLPERVASHFNAAGAPDAWMAKKAFVQTMLFFIAVMTVLFPALALLIRKTPASMINMPNKSYWFAPERKEETLAFITGRLYGLGSATMLLFLDLFHQSFQVQLGRAGAMDHPLTSVAIYLVLMAVLTFGMLIRFLRKP